MTQRKYRPLPEDHPLITDGSQCPGCNQKFKPGDLTTIVVIGPGDDPENQLKAREGREFAAIGSVAHWSCVTGEV